MRFFACLLMALVMVASPVQANVATSLAIQFKLKLLRHDRDNYAADWNKIEAKRKQFVQAGNAQMAQIAKEEADAAARRYQELDSEIKALELEKARAELRN